MAKIRVSELAKEYRVPSRTIIEMLTNLGEFVKSAASGVEPVAVKRLMEAYGDQLRSSRSDGDQRAAQPPRPDPPQVRRASTWPPPAPNPFARKAVARSRQRRTPPSHPAPPAKLIEASQMFGVPVDQLKPQREKDAWGRYKSSESRRPVDVWTLAFFEPQDARAWINAGLGPDDVRIAEECIRAGLRPEHLSTIVDGRTIAARLRDSEPLRQVLARMRAAQGNRSKPDAG